MCCVRTLLWLHPSSCVLHLDRCSTLLLCSPPPSPAACASHRLDNGPLVPGCTCFCCANHTRAYLHHLLHTHEMLGGVLLEMHNTHWWLGFFHAMRSAIQQGEWAAYQQWVLQRRVSRSQGQLNQQQKLAAVS